MERIVIAIETQMTFSNEEMWEKFIACDRWYDGLFYIAVKTTKIYCRPSCRSRKPKKVNVRFYFNRDEVEKGGFRPCKRCKPELEHSPHVDVVRKTHAFLLNHYQQPLHLKEISDQVGLSPFHLERIFKQETSTTPRKYVEKIRIDQAAYLLKSTSMTNIAICYEVGFKSPSTFYKVFRRIKNCSPSKYRKDCAHEMDGS